MFFLQYHPLKSHVLSPPPPTPLFGLLNSPFLFLTRMWISTYSKKLSMVRWNENRKKKKNSQALCKDLQPIRYGKISKFTISFKFFKPYLFKTGILNFILIYPLKPLEIFTAKIQIYPISLTVWNINLTTVWKLPTLNARQESECILLAWLPG